jgi:hypothetical protein
MRRAALWRTLTLRMLYIITRSLAWLTAEVAEKRARKMQTHSVDD